MSCNCNSISINNGVNGTNGTYGGYSDGWDYDSSSTGAGAPVQHFRLNNSDNSLVTTIYVNTTNSSGVIVDGFVDSFVNTLTATNYYGYLRLFSELDSTKFAFYKITNITSPSGTERALTVTYVDGNGSFTAGTTIVFTFTPKGEKGTAGSNGSNGTNGTNGAAGAQGSYGGYTEPWLFDTGTGITPASGDIRFNNATLGSVTHLYINNTNSDAISAVDFLGSLDNGGLFGYFRVAKITTGPGNFLAGKITAITVAAGYYDLTVVITASNGSFANNDPLFFTFSPGSNLSQAFVYEGKLPAVASNVGLKDLSNGLTLIPGTTAGDTITLTDTLNTYNTTTGVWTCPSTGYYNLSFLVLENVEGANPGTGVITVGITDTTGNTVYCISQVNLADGKTVTLIPQSSTTYKYITSGSTLYLKILNNTGNNFLGNANGGAGSAAKLMKISIVRVA